MSQKPYSCSVCQDMRIVSKDVPYTHPDFGKAFPCPVCGVSYKQDQLLKLSRLNERQAQVTLEDLDEYERPQTQVMKDMVAKVMRQELAWLTLIGKPGVGKSTALYAVVNHFRGQGIKAVYLDWSTLLEFIREGFDPRSETSSQWRFELALNAPVVCLDEIDKARPTEWALEQLHRFVNHRWEMAQVSSPQQLITVFAMNTEPENEHIRSRLLDKRFGFVYNYDADFRTEMW